MKITDIRESLEQCNEAGWYAYDFFTAQPLSEEDIFRLKDLGSFCYLPMLKAPFFKVEAAYLHVKGIRGKDHFRVAVHKDHFDLLEKVKAAAEG